MTPDEAIACLDELQEKDDRQSLHRAADAILLRFLIELGYGGVAEAFVERLYCSNDTPLHLH